MSEIAVRVTRGGRVESIHRMDAALVAVNGKLLDFVGDPGREMYWRSAAKPFQVLPLVERSGLERFGITIEELALMTASHGGEVVHTELALRILQKIGLAADDLACGVAAPLYRQRAEAMQLAGEPYTAVHNNCSGKHACMLALTQLLGTPVSGYTRLEHPVQQLMLTTVAECTGVAREAVGTGIDGCGVPVFWLPIRNMAWAYARLAKPESGDWQKREDHIRRIRDAMVAKPVVVGGTGFFETRLMEVTGGRIVAKSGAEAMYCMASLPEGIGIAYKIDDGASRAVPHAGIALLRRHGLLSAEEAAELTKSFPPIVKNHCGDIVGEIETSI